jgi:hypothetical protein
MHQHYFEQVQHKRPDYVLLQIANPATLTHHILAAVRCVLTPCRDLAPDVTDAMLQSAFAQFYSSVRSAKVGRV